MTICVAQISRKGGDRFMKLDIGTPVITSHHYYALPLAIICGDDALKRWVYSEFIQWYTYRDHEDERTRVSLYKDNNERYKFEPLYETEIGRAHV